MSWLRHARDTVGEDRLELAGAAFLLLLALLVFFWPAVFNGRVLLPVDLIFDLDPLWRPLAPEGYAGPSNSLLADQVYQFHPWKVFARRSIARGQLPLWNPHTDGGVPFVGNAQSALFSPFNLVSYLLPLYPSYVITAILRLLVAGVFTFLFAREIGMRPFGALLAMMTFTFSGPMVVWLGHPHSFVIVWLPAILFTTERALVQRDARYVAASGLLIAAQFLGGHPETSFHVILVWLAYSLYRVASLEGWHLSRWSSSLMRICAMALTGILVAAIQLLPFAEALFHSATLSARASEAASDALLSLTRLFLDWHRWPTVITAVLPQYFGTSLDDSYWFPYSNYVEQNAYVGVLPLTLATVTVIRNLRPPFSPKRNWVLLFALVALVCLGVALHLPGLNLINALPPLSVTANGRLRLVYAFAVAILAGLGLDAISTEIRSRRLSVSHVLIILSVLSMLLIGATYTGLLLFRDEVIQSGRDFMEANWNTTPYLSRPLEYYYGLVEERYHKKLALYHPKNVTMYVPVLTTVVWIGIRKLRRNTGASAEMWRWATLGLVVFDLFVTGLPFNPTVAPDVIFPEPQAIKLLHRDQTLYRVSGTDLALYPNSGMLFGLQDVRGYETVVPRRYVELVDRLDGHHRFHFHSLFREADSTLWDLLNVKYVLTNQMLEGKWDPINQTGVHVFRNTNVLPRAFVVHRTAVVDGPDESLEQVMDPSFDFREEVVLEQTPSRWVEPSGEVVPGASAQIVDYQPNRVVVEVKTPADGLLVLTDTYAPGWQALVDGKSAPLYVANHAFRAVVVPDGSHRVTFAYRPNSFYVGVGLSLLGLIVVGVRLLVPQRNHSARLPQ